MSNSLPYFLERSTNHTQIELENERLQNTVQSKTGENAILRQKQDKHAKDADQKISALMQLHAEKDAKKNAELERIKREREKVVTDNRFLEHDLALETGKNRQTQKTLKVGNATRSNSGQRTNLNVTPKKAKVLPYRDGFDDGDLVMLSPSKLRDRSKPSTPKAGAKRKRTGKEVQSPIPLPQLPLSEPKPPSLPPQAQAEARVASDLAIRLAKEQNKARSMQKLQRHHIGESEENLFETLTRFAFPSQPDRKLSTLVFEELSTKSVTNNSGSVPDQCCKILSSLWEQCLAETYYQPLPCIINSMQFILDAERFAFARQYITKLVPLAIATSDLVAIPVARASLNKNQSPKPPAPASTTTAPLLGEPGTSTQAVEAASCIDVSACLALLQGLAEAAAPDGIAIKEFWRHMKFDFVLLVLMKAQPIRQIVLMLELLQGSALEESFGAILGEDEGGRERQARREVDTVDRLTLLLSESFDVGDSAVKVLDSATVFELRAKVVDVLMSLCLHEHGALLLATHRSAIGRLFKFLHDTINNLYLYTHASDHVPLTRAINDTMKILALLCTGNPNVDVRQKLGALPGGTHVHLLALTRLAFAERVWFERGIEEGTVERAHEMLDEWLSPEEGEGLMMMFGSSGSGDSEM